MDAWIEIRAKTVQLNKFAGGTGDAAGAAGADAAAEPEAEPEEERGGKSWATLPFEAIEGEDDKWFFVSISADKRVNKKRKTKPRHTTDDMRQRMMYCKTYMLRMTPTETIPANAALKWLTYGMIIKSDYNHTPKFDKGLLESRPDDKHRKQANVTPSTSAMIEGCVLPKSAVFCGTGLGAG